MVLEPIEGVCCTESASTAALVKDVVPQLQHLSATTLGKTSSCSVPHPVAAVSVVELPCGSVAVAGGGNTVSIQLVTSLLRSCPQEGADGTFIKPFSDGVGVDDVALAQKTTSVVSGGLVSCIGNALLPGGTAAVCAVGTTAGSLCLFVIEGKLSDGVPTLCKVCETSLCEYTDGLISADDIVLDVCVGLDPAGRPEFVAVATATVVVVVDTQSFHDLFRGSAMEASLKANAGSFPHVLFSDKRPLNETFYASFSSCEVVRLLTPQRYRASFAIDVALVIVFDSGEVRYVERHVVGGSLQLLIEHHRQRQLRQSVVGLGMLHQSTESPAGAFHSTLALPHIVYAYSLSSVVHNVCEAAVGVRAATHKAVNDAVLFFDDASHQMRMIVIGAEVQGTQRHSNQLRDTGGWWAVTTAVVLPRGTLGQRRLLAWSFGVPGSGVLTRGWGGLASVAVVESGTVLFVYGNQLYACGVAEVSNAIDDASGASTGGEPNINLRLVHSCSSVICGVACTDVRRNEKNVVVIGFSASLVALQL